MVFGMSGGVRGMARTMRCDSLELWQGLVLHGMGEVDFHVFGKYWKRSSSPNTPKLVLGPPDWSSEFFRSGAHDICWSGAHDIVWEWRTQYFVELPLNLEPELGT